MSFFLDGLDPIQLTVLANILAISFSNGLSADEINILSNFIEAIGQNLGVIAAAQSAQESAQDSK